jgi:diacylglycerol O-acyltransferase-1
MKLYSFGKVIREARDSFISKKHEKLPNEFKALISKYPNLISLHDFGYFMFFPTLCFQFKYPRSERVRKTWVFKRFVEYFVSVALMLIMIQQYITPLLKNTFKILEQEEVNYMGLLERHLKLSLPNLYLWLFLFYSGFQCTLNILAELTRFADREFYLEWWNSRTLGEYWRKWNIPVHSWLLRHVYKPMVADGYGKNFSMFFTFFLSAVAHEYLISGACRILTYWAFIAMMSQIPMIIVMDLFKKQLERSQIGNVVFWVSFCIIGQPIAVLIYSYQAYTSIKADS